MSKYDYVFLSLNAQHFADAVWIARVIYESSLVASGGGVDHLELVYFEHVAADAFRFVVLLALVAQLMSYYFARILVDHLRLIDVN